MGRGSRADIRVKAVKLALERYWVETDRSGASPPLIDEEIDYIQRLADKIEKVLDNEQSNFDG